MPTAQISGYLNLNSTLIATFPVGTGVLNSYTIPVQPSDSHSYTPGTAANQANKLAQLKASAAAAPATIDLTSVVCVDGSAGVGHVREGVAYNDSLLYDLILDLSVSNSFLGAFSGTTVKYTIPPGGWCYFASKPLGTNGYVVDSTHKILTLDPLANTVAYRVILLGD